LIILVGNAVLVQAGFHHKTYPPLPWILMVWHWPPECTRKRGR